MLLINYYQYRKQRDKRSGNYIPKIILPPIISNEVLTKVNPLKNCETKRRLTKNFEFR